MKAPKLTSDQKLAFYKENGYWFGEVTKAKIQAKTTAINREVFSNVEVEIMSVSERVAIEELNISMRAKAIKNNL